MNDKSSNDKKEIEELLGKPFVEEIPNNLWVTRRSLLFFSSIALASIIFNWKIAFDNTLNTPIGLLKGINDNHFYIILFFIIIYLWSLFYVSSNAYKSRKKIRGTGLSGSLPPLAGGFSIREIGSYPKNIEQHTLYSFWLEHRDTAQNNFQIVTNFCKEISQNKDQEFISSNILKIKDASEKLSEIFGNTYVLTALERFDKEFKSHQNKESKKYFLELKLPHLLAFSATMTISYKLILGYDYLFNISSYLKKLFFLL